MRDDALKKVSLIAGLKLYGKASYEFQGVKSVADGCKKYGIDLHSYKEGGSGLLWGDPDIKVYESAKEYIKFIQKCFDFTKNDLEQDPEYVWDTYKTFIGSGDFSYLFDPYTETGYDWCHHKTVFDICPFGYGYIYVDETQEISIIRIDMTDQEAREYLTKIIKEA